MSYVVTLCYFQYIFISPTVQKRERPNHPVGPRDLARQKNNFKPSREEFAILLAMPLL
jgi:hypothetical protein